MLNKLEQIVKQADKLEEYAELEGTELGEYWNLLSTLSHYYEYMDKEFQPDFEDELIRILNFVKSNFEIKKVSTIQTITKMTLVDKNESH